MILLLCVCLALAASAAGQELPTVNITQGTVIGSFATDGNYLEFYGIPYGGNTAGENRFKAPLPAPSFGSTPFVANRRNIKCVRPLGTGFEGTEDCLVANIFTPTINNTRRLPVMVWVKGKEFDQENLPELSFRNFVQKDVIIVSLNYRESVFGFLCLGTETAPGNAGLKDIIGGLKWVKDNIAQFGGNPEEITLFGHGTGAAAVDLVTLSPMANGLIQKAIVQSGNALAPWAVTRDNLAHAILIAQSFGHDIISTEQLSNLFSRSSVSALMGVINVLDLTDNSLAFAPCVERHDLEGVESFLSKTPSEIIRDAEFQPIPIIIGFVDNEGTIRAREASNWLGRMESSFPDFLQSDLKFENDAEKLSVAQRIQEFYFEENSFNMQNYFRYHGDTMMLVSSIREVRYRISSSLSPIYLYQFSYSGTLGEPFVGPIAVGSAAHSEELAYMFYNNTVTGTHDRDQTVGDILVERWANFAKTGNPTSETSPVSWRPVTRNFFNFLRVLEMSEVIEDSTLEVLLLNPHPQIVTFWNNIYNDYFLDAESNWEIDDPTDPPPTEALPVIDASTSTTSTTDASTSTTSTAEGSTSTTSTTEGSTSTTSSTEGSSSTTSITEGSTSTTSSTEGITSTTTTTEGTTSTTTTTDGSTSTTSSTEGNTLTTPTTEGSTSTTSTTDGSTSTPSTTEGSTSTISTTDGSTATTSTTDGSTSTTSTTDESTSTTSTTEGSTPTTSTTEGSSSTTSTTDGNTSTTSTTEGSTSTTSTTDGSTSTTSTTDGSTPTTSTTDGSTSTTSTTEGSSSTTSTTDGSTSTTSTTEGSSSTTSTTDGSTSTTSTTEGSTSTTSTTEGSSSTTSTIEGSSSTTSTTDGSTSTTSTTEGSTSTTSTTEDSSSTTSTTDGSTSTTSPTEGSTSTTTTTTTEGSSSTTSTTDGSTSTTSTTDYITDEVTGEPDTTEKVTTEESFTEEASTDGSTTVEPNSASTAVGYTFFLVVLFSLLSHLHSSLILS